MRQFRDTLILALYNLVDLSRHVGWRVGGPLSLRAVNSERPDFRTIKRENILSPRHTSLVSRPHFPSPEIGHAYNDVFSHGSNCGFAHRDPPSRTHTEAVVPHSPRIPGLLSAPPHHRYSTFLHCRSLGPILSSMEDGLPPPSRRLSLRRLPVASPWPSPSQTRRTDGSGQRFKRNL